MQTTGSLDDLSAAALLRCAARAHFSGALELESERVVIRLALSGGDVVHARSSDADDHLAEWLLRAGVLDRPTFEEVAKDSDSGRALGKLLLERGLLTPGGLREYASRQIADIGSSVLTWRQGTYTFASGEVGMRGLDVSTSDIILRGARAIKRWSDLAVSVGDLATRYRTSSDLDRLTTPMNLTHGEWGLLAQFGQLRTIRDACATSRLGDFRVHQTILALWTLALLDRLEDPVGERLAELVEQLSGADGVGDTPVPRSELPAFDGRQGDSHESVEVADEVSFRGDLNGTNLPDILRTLYQERRTGALELRSETLCATAYFTRGAVVAARSTAPESRLGEVLVRLGQLDSDGVEDAMRDAGGERLGPWLVRQGRLTETQLRDAVETQIRDVLVPVFNWARGAYTFTDAEPVEAEASVSELSTAQVILEGVRRMADLRGIEEFFRNLEAPLQLASDPHMAFQKLDIRPDEGFLLSRVDGTATSRAIMDLSPLSEEDTSRILYAFVAIGLVEAADPAPVVVERPATKEAAATIIPPKGADGAPSPAPQPRPAAKQDARKKSGAFGRAVPPTSNEIEEMYQHLAKHDHHSILSIDRTASQDEVESGFHRTALRFHPDRGRTPLDKERLEAIFARVVEAVEVLRNPENRRGYEDLLERSEDPAPLVQAIPQTSSPTATHTDAHDDAEGCVKRARSALGKSQYWDAIRLLQHAVKLAPEEISYRLLLGRTLARNQKWRKAAEEQLLIVADKAPWNAAAFTELGVLYKKGGLASRAKSMFEQALALDPGNVVARREIGKGGTPSAPASSLGGLFRRLVKPGDSGEQGHGADATRTSSTDSDG